MRNHRFNFGLFLIILFVIQVKVLAQANNEQQIKTLERQEKEAVVMGDTSILYKLWSPNYVTNGSMNIVVSIQDMKNYYRKGAVEHIPFERIIEKITFSDNLPIVMGKEIKQAVQGTNNIGKPVTRRFTNIWVKTEGVWLLTARQVTNLN